MEENKTRVIAVSIPNDLLAALDKAAAKEDRTRSNMICRFIKYALTDIMKEDNND